MKRPAVTVVDFETLPIDQRPEYPPKPVSMAIREPGKKAKSFLWGHPSGNNCSLADAKRALQSVWKPGRKLLFHNAKFDTDVAETHMGVKRMDSLDYEDTMFLSYLRDPHARDVSLKGLAENLLGWEPEERDAVHVWAKANKVYCLSKFYTKPFRPGAYIGYAPGEIVQPYVKGDVDRTLGLWNDNWDYVNSNGMMPAYEREKKCMTIFLDNERVGIRVDVPKLRADVKRYSAALEATDNWLRRKLKTNCSFDNDVDTAEALERSGQVRPELWVMTKGGQRSVSKDNLTPDMFKDKTVASALGYRNRLSTCLKMFMISWLAQAEVMGGYITTNWNQVAGPGGGTRTGRPSTNKHNFLNVSKTWGVDDGYIHPAKLEFLTAMELPLVRKYMLPDEGEVWLHRDYNGQELRLLAHAEDGPLMEAYKADPWLDVHQHVADMIENVTGKTFARKNVKIANFRIIYGGGAPATAAGIGCSLGEAKELLDAHGIALPSVKGRGGLADTTKAIGRAGDAIVTWGGRMYYVEPPSFSKKYGRHMTYEYKLLNYYCQGSAADVTKQALINYHEHPKRRGRFLVTVYDEINSSSGKNPKAEMAVLRESMECVSEELDVPMLSEGKAGPTWGDQKKFEEGPSKYA